MSTDRELLEAAAKAAGWKGWRSKHGYWNLESPEGKAHTCCTGWPSYSATNGEKLPEPTFGDALAEVDWNALTDDGDALRLACKLKLNIAQGDYSANVNDEGAIEEGGLVRNDDERAEVVRRLIVVAAAAMAERAAVGAA